MKKPVQIIEEVERDSESAEYFVGGLCALKIISDLARAGYVIVPKEPTKEMLFAGGECVPGDGDGARLAASIYREMTDATNA